MNRKKESAVSKDNSPEPRAKYLVVAQIAERWACDPSRVYREIAAGRLRALHIGDQTKRVSVEELARYESERTGVSA